MNACPECGAAGESPCEELFHRLLALDHSRREPWGPLHGVAVACYHLQHPDSLPGGAHDFTLRLLRAHVESGPEAARKLTEGARRANSHRNRQSEHAAGAPRKGAPSGFAFTIAEASGGGHFPVEGHPERVRAWAEATLSAWRD